MNKNRKLNTLPHRLDLRILAMTLGIYMGLFTTAQAAESMSKAPPAKASPGKRADDKSATVVQTAVPRSSTLTYAPQINVATGKSMVLKLPVSAARISVGDPAVADVLLLNKEEIYVLGKKAGSTNLIVWSKSEQTMVVDVLVGIDVAGLQGKLQQFMPEEKNIRVAATTDSLILSGVVTDAIKVDRALALAEAYAGKKVVNLLSVGGVQQVMLEVKIAEINRTMAEKLGFDFSRQLTSGGGAWTKTLSGIFGGGPAKFNQNYNATRKIAPAELIVKGTTNSGLVLPIDVPGGIPGVVSATTPAGAGTEIKVLNSMLQQTNTNMATQDFTSWLIDAEKKDGLVKILAEPNIVAINGQEGSFLAGGEIMIPVQQSSGTTTLESKQFGVGLRFTPTVIEDGRIHMRVQPEVTDLVGFTSVANTGLGASVLVPTLTTRRVSTTVELREGQSLAIGGLLSDNFRESVNRFPVLGEIPILGALFRSSEFQKNKTELLIVVTPRLVKPLPPNFVLPTDNFKEPSRSEFFFGGKMEGEPNAPQPDEDAPKAALKGAEAPQQDKSGGFEMK